MWWAMALALVVLLAGCAAPPPAFVTPIPSTPRSIATLSADRTVSVAVAVSSATPTPQLVGDYPSLVRPRLDRVQQGLGHLEQQLNILNTNPMRMAEADWRSQMQSLLEDLASANTDLQSLG